MVKVIKILLLFSLSVSVSPVFAQSPYINNSIYSEKYPIELLPVQDALMRAQELDAQKKFSEAIEELTKAIEMQPDQAYLYYARGSEYCNQALELDAIGKAPVKDDKARGLCKQAIEDFTKAISLEPGNARYHYRRGNSYVLIGDDASAALADYSMSIKLDPENAVYYAARAGVYGVMLKNEKALADYTRAISLKADNAEYYAGRAALYVKTGEYDKALSDYNQAISLDPDNAYYYAERGLLYKFIKSYSGKAIDDFSKAISLNPGEVLFTSYRGACYRSVNNLLKARDDLARSCEQGIKSDCESLAEIERDIARGDKWVYVGSTDRGNYYYDGSTVINTNKNAATAWTRIEMKHGEGENSSADFYENKNAVAVRDRSEVKRTQDEKSPPLPPWYAVMYSVYNCTKRESADIQMVKYNAGGFVLSSKIYASIDYKRIVPGSIGELIMQIMCRDNTTPIKKAKKSQTSKPKKKSTCRTVTICD